MADRRFLKPGPWLQGRFRVRDMMPSFTADAGDAVLNLNLSEGMVNQADGDTANAVVARCNLHHEGPLNSNEIRAAISRWKEGQEMVVSMLDKILGSA